MNRWGILAVLFGARAVMGFQFQSVGSIADFLIADFGIDYTKIGTLVGLYLLPGIIVAYPSGGLGKRFGDQRIVLIGLLLMAIGGTLIGLSADYTTAMVGRILCGTGAVFLNVLLTKMLIDWFVGRETILAMAIFVNSWPFGIAAGLVSQGIIADALSWQVVQHITAILAAIGFLMILVFYSPPREDTNTPGTHTENRSLSLREIYLTCISGAIWCFYNVSIVIILSFAPTFLQSRGVPATEAAPLVSIGTWLGIIAVPTAGLIAQRFSAPNTVILTCLVSTLVAVIWMLEASWFLGPFILFGIFAWAPAGSIVALPAEVLSAKNRGPGMGIFFIWYYVGMGTLPAVAGFSLDMTGDPAAPIYFAAASMFLCIPLLAMFRLMKRQDE